MPASLFSFTEADLRVGIDAALDSSAVPVATVAAAPNSVSVQCWVALTPQCGLDDDASLRRRPSTVVGCAPSWGRVFVPTALRSVASSVGGVVPWLRVDDGGDIGLEPIPWSRWAIDPAGGRSDEAPAFLGGAVAGSWDSPSVRVAHSEQRSTSRLAWGAAAVIEDTCPVLVPVATKDFSGVWVCPLGHCVAGDAGWGLMHGSFRDGIGHTLESDD